MHSPGYRHEKLTESAGTAANNDYSASIDVTSEAYTEETAEETNAGDHHRHGESILHPCNGEEVRCVNVDPRRSYHLNQLKSS
jgi:hypothetical protein